MALKIDLTTCQKCGGRNFPQMVHTCVCGCREETPFNAKRICSEHQPRQVNEDKDAD